MLRAEMIEAVNQIVEALTSSRLRQALRFISARPKTIDIPSEALIDFFTGLRKYSIMAQQFTPTAKQLTQILGIDSLDNPSTWPELMGLINKDRVSNPASQLYTNVRFALEHLPKIINLLHPKHLEIVKKSLLEENPRYKDLDILSIIIIEDDNQLSSVERIITALQSVQNVYNACAVINNIQPEKLGLISCDSGSDKSIDLLGTSKIVECVKEIILQMYDNIVYYKEKKAMMKQDVVMRNLTMLEKVGDLEKDNSISQEQAELLKRQLVDGATGLLNAGVIIPEIQRRAHNNPRQLMAPSPKLLTVTRVGDNKQSNTIEGEVVEGHVQESRNSRDPDDSSLTAEEQAELQRLIRKFQQNKGTSNQADETTDS